MTSPELPSSDRRKAIPATCQLNQGPAGLVNLMVSKQSVNLMVSKQSESIVLDPRVTGACVISLYEDSARTLRDLLTEWLK